MSAPLRINPRQQKKAVSAGSEGTEQAKFYLEKLLKLIPAEAQTLFVLHTLIPKDPQKADPLTLWLWIGFCFVVIIVVRVFGTSDQRTSTPPDWIHVILSCIAFLLWLMSLGMVFPALQQERPYAVILLMAAFTFLVPYFYKKA